MVAAGGRLIEFSVKIWTKKEKHLNPNAEVEARVVCQSGVACSVE